MTCCKQAQHAATQLDLYKGATKGMLPHASSTSEQRTESTIEVNAPHEDIQTWRQKFDKGCGQIHAHDVHIRTCACHGCPCGAESPKKTTRRRRSLGSSATATATATASAANAFHWQLDLLDGGLHFLADKIRSLRHASTQRMRLVPPAWPYSFACTRRGFAQRRRRACPPMDSQPSLASLG